MATLTKFEALQLGRAEFGRILDGKKPDVGAILSLGAFLFVRLKMQGKTEGFSVEQISQIVENILRESLEIAEKEGIAVEQLTELKELAGKYKDYIEPVLMASLSGVASLVGPDVTAASPRWKRVLAAALRVFRVCVSVAAVASVATSAYGRKHEPVAAVATAVTVAPTSLEPAAAVTVEVVAVDDIAVTVVPAPLEPTEEPVQEQPELPPAPTPPSTPEHVPQESPLVAA